MQNEFFSKSVEMKRGCSITLFYLWYNYQFFQHLYVIHDAERLRINAR